jgi:chromosome partitioning protein
MQTIALYNLKGGVGKTTTAVNLAYLSAAAKHNTVLWDWDPQGAVGWYFGIDALPKRSIRLISRGLPVGELEITTPYPRLSVIPADLSLRKVDIELAQQGGAGRVIRKLVEPLGENASTLIFDCPPSLSPSIEYLLSGVDLLLVPMIPSPLSVRAMQQVVEFFEGKKRAPKRIVGFFNQVDRRRNLHKQILAEAKKMPVPMLKTWIPVDSAAEMMSERRAPLTSYARFGRAASAYRKMWREVNRILAKDS